MVFAILGAVVGLVVMSGRPIARGQEARSAVKTVQQSVWQGATSAASRGVRTNLVHAGGRLEVRNAATNEVIRRFELPEDASINAPDGTLLVFTPPGKVDEASLASLPDPFQVTAGGQVTQLEVSLIGEVRIVGGG